jgi:5'-deoxynucleotidase YfbR-like HD superfamily hydrolase
MKTAADIYNNLARFTDLLIDFCAIQREIYYPDRTNRTDRESDAEHSYTLAMCAWYLNDSLNLKMNQEKLLSYALCHDLVEIYAGDVSGVNRTKQQAATKRKKEAAALQKLEADWSDFTSMTKTIHTYEHRDDPESQFVYAIDKILPVIINLLGDGKTWQEYRYTTEAVISSRDTKVRVSPVIASVWEEVKKELEKHPEFFLQPAKSKT